MPRTARLSFFVTVLVITGLAFSTASRHWAQEHAAVADAAAPQELIPDEGAQVVTAGTDGVVLPGGKGDLVVQLRNVDGAAIHVLAVEQAGAAHVAHRDDCANMAALLTVLPTTGLVFEVPAGQTGEVRVPDAVYLSRQAGVECAGATFSVPVVVTYSH